MPCPFCSSDTYITRNHGTHRIRRCLSCHREFKTIEILEVQQEAAQFSRFLLDKLTRNGT